MKTIAIIIFITSLSAHAQDVTFEEEVIEKRFIMKPQPITYSADELLKFLKALEFNWKIIDLPAGATIGVCPAVQPDKCLWIPPNLRDEFIGKFLAL